MRRRSWLWFGLLTVGLLSGSGAVLWWLLRCEPDFYRTAAVLAGPQRTRLSAEFHGKTLNFLTNVFVDKEPRWAESFAAEPINCYFAEDFTLVRPEDRILPQGLHSPRLAFEDDRLRLGMQFGRGNSSIVLSLDLRVWLVAKKDNAIALEVLGLRAGAIPLPTQMLLERISEIVRPLNIEVNWYRHNGHPVAILQLQADQARPTVLVQRLQFSAGRLDLAGQALEVAPRGATLPVMAPSGVGPTRKPS
jgi:hypothetical protein